jgi:hypothetical protein
MAAIEPIEGDDQSVPAGTAVSVRPAVRVLQRGEPVAGLEVTFAVAAGGGTVSGATQTTNDEGLARVGAWVLGAQPGLNPLEASAEGASGSPVGFTAEGTAGSGVDRMVFVVQPPEDVEPRSASALSRATRCSSATGSGRLRRGWPCSTTSASPILGDTVSGRSPMTFPSTSRKGRSRRC